MLDIQLNDAFVRNGNRVVVKKPSGGIPSDWNRNVDFGSTSYLSRRLRWGSRTKSRKCKEPANIDAGFEFPSPLEITFCGHLPK